MLTLRGDPALLAAFATRDDARDEGEDSAEAAAAAACAAADARLVLGSGLTLVFQSIKDVEEGDDILANPQNERIALFQGQSSEFTKDERAYAHMIHVEVMQLAPLEGLTTGPVLYKGNTNFGLFWAPVRRARRPGAGYVFVHVPASVAQVTAFHTFYAKLCDARTRCDPTLTSLALMGCVTPSIRTMTCSESIVLALREANISLLEPRLAHTGGLLPAKLITPSRLYTCLMRLVIVDRAHVLLDDPLRVGRAVLPHYLRPVSYTHLTLPTTPYV